MIELMLTIDLPPVLAICSAASLVPRKTLGIFLGGQGVPLWLWNASNVERSLAAILAADVPGYSWPIGGDDGSTAGLTGLGKKLIWINPYRQTSAILIYQSKEEEMAIVKSVKFVGQRGKPSTPVGPVPVNGTVTYDILGDAVDASFAQRYRGHCVVKAQVHSSSTYIGEGGPSTSSTLTWVQRLFADLGEVKITTTNDITATYNVTFTLPPTTISHSGSYIYSSFATGLIETTVNITPLFPNPLPTTAQNSDTEVV
jgi:hypothetical protein